MLTCWHEYILWVDNLLTYNGFEYLFLDISSLMNILLVNLVALSYNCPGELYTNERVGVQHSQN